jgi:hypothetical protein
VLREPNTDYPDCTDVSHSEMFAKLLTCVLLGQGSFKYAMRNLFRRIWRYVNYAPNTHSKTEEVRQLVQKVDAMVENVRIKTTAVETDLRYLKTMTVALQNQLNGIQDHLRSTQPWIPSSKESDQRPVGWLLTSLVGLFPNPIVVNIGLNEEELFEGLLDAGFSVYTFESQAKRAANLLERFNDCPRLHVLDAVSESLGLLAERKEIPAGFSVLRITAKDLESSMATDVDRLSPEVVDTPFSSQDAVAADELAAGKQLIREMRKFGYHWNLLVFRMANAPAFRFAANLSRTPDMSSGDLLFFKSFELFERTYRWAQLVLPRFQHLRSPDPS